MVQLSHPYMTTGKNVALTRWTFVSKIISLLFNMLSQFVTAFLPRSKHFLISWLQSPSAGILEPKKIKSVTISFFPPIYLPQSSSSLFAIRVVSSSYLMLLIFLPAILIPTCASSSLASRMMYSAYKLNKEPDNIQPWSVSKWNKLSGPLPLHVWAEQVREACPQ